MSKRILLIFIVLSLLSVKNFATHIVGGEIYYDYLGNNDYKITLKVYRDCYNGVPPLDQPAYVFIYDNAGNFQDSIAMPLPGTTLIPPVINNPCFVPPTNVCVEEGIYTSIINLPPIPGGYYLSYQRCCRNGTILNLIDPGSVGSTYMAHIPDTTMAVTNSSPRYNNFPPIFICQGVPLIFDHSASDLDGDSLYYEFCDPFHGASTDCPVLGPGNPDCPEVGPPPPFPFVPWLSPYSGSYPLASSPAMAIDPHTGLMTGTPTTLGQWVVGVCVSEYRNGVLLDVNKRDFQFNVTECPGIPVASIPMQNTFCFGYLTNFFQNSVNAFSYNWNFGDPTTTNDTSTAASPNWTFPASGTYTVTLIINEGSLCADTNTTTFDIQHLLDPKFSPPPGECVSNNSYDFSAGGDYQGNGTFLWDFGTHAAPQTSTSINPVDIRFDTSGVFPVTFTVTENGCTKQYISNVEVYAKPIAYYGLESAIACELQPVHFIDSSRAETPLTYQWTFGDGGSSTLQDPFHTYGSVGTYPTQLIVTSTRGCIDTFALSASTSVYPLPHANFYISPKDTSIFYADISITDQSAGAVSCIVDWGDGTIYNNCDTLHAYKKPGTYNIMQVVTNIYGCKDTAYSEVLIRPEFIIWIPNAFTPGKVDGVNDIFKPKLIGVHDYNFLIFDRWGEKIFETHNSEDGWDGIYKGRLCTNDVYVYKVFFRDDIRNDYHEFIGRVTLVR